MIQTEPTPNPESLKFLSEKIISAIGTEEFQKNEIDKVSNPFIKELLGFKGVELVLFSKIFLSVKKTKDVSWNELKPMVISHLNLFIINREAESQRRWSGQYTQQSHNSSQHQYQLYLHHHKIDHQNLCF